MHMRSGDEKPWCQVSDHVQHQILCGGGTGAGEGQMFVCPECRRVDFYWMENDLLDEDNEQRFYDMYKNEPTDKLRKILDSGSYTDECKSVIRKILSER